jgi:hypothetical protein
LLIAKKCLYVCLSMFIAYTWLNHKPYDNFESHKMPFYGATWKKTLGACHCILEKTVFGIQTFSWCNMMIKMGQAFLSD